MDTVEVVEKLGDIEKTARLAHSSVNQLYAQQHPYSFHLEQVVAVATRFIDQLEDDSLYSVSKVLAACWLHDIIEDCRWTYKDVKEATNEDIAEIVYSVTDELGRNRTERKTKTYPKTAANRLGVFVKLCDRIANTQYSQSTARDSAKSAYMATSYCNEYPVFRTALYQPGEYPELWAYADKVHGW